MGVFYYIIPNILQKQKGMRQGFMEFKKANMPIKAAAQALGMDCQTVRILCQQGIVPWGIVFKRPGSRRYSYLILPKSFFENTGFLWKGEED